MSYFGAKIAVGLPFEVATVFIDRVGDMIGNTVMAFFKKIFVPQLDLFEYSCKSNFFFGIE